jgi:hypothetical protein
MEITTIRMGMLFTTLLIIASLNLAGSAFAWTVSNGYYSHEHATSLTNGHLVCGDHKCALDEVIQHPLATHSKGTR